MKFNYKNKNGYISQNNIYKWEDVIATYNKVYSVFN